MHLSGIWDQLDFLGPPEHMLIQNLQFGTMHLEMLYCIFCDILR